MLIIGLAGGIASGKSLVAKCFEQQGAVIIDADKIGHQVLCLSEVIQAISNTWGESVLADGQVDRSALAAIVFKGGDDNRQLAKLEQITHPRIQQRLSAEFERLRSNGETRAVVLDAPVMFKAGWDKLCDKIVFVRATYEVRLARALERGWDENELDHRESRQTALDIKQKLSTDLIDNSESIESTQKQVLRLWQTWELNHNEEN